MAKRDPNIDHDTVRLRGWVDLAIGLVMFAIGAILFAVTHAHAAGSSTTAYTGYVAILAGGLTAARGIWRLVRTPTAGAATSKLELFGFGYKSFVAWRYLMIANRKVRPTTTLLLAIGLPVLIAFILVCALCFEPTFALVHTQAFVAMMAALMFVVVVVFLGVLPYSKPALIVGLVGIVMLVLSLASLKLVGLPRLPLMHLDPAQVEALRPGLAITAIISGAVAVIAMLFGCLRGYFTFFTTVPIGGVWIGTAALVIVLSVMGGFESDLRQKILGSNAHLQITREDGDFVEWRDVKAQIDQMPGVVASTPFAVSEVVVAANNTGMNVIIKGIDPKTVGKVTDLVSDLEDHESMKRLDPIAVDSPDLRVPQHPRTDAAPVMDPPPEDMPTPGEPIDFSGTGPDAGSAGGSAEGRGSAAGSSSGNKDTGAGTPLAAGSTDSGAGAELEGPPPLDGDAQRLRDAEKLYANEPPIGKAPAKAIDKMSDLDVLDKPSGSREPAGGTSGHDAARAVIDPRSGIAGGGDPDGLAGGAGGGAHRGIDPRSGIAGGAAHRGIDPPPPDLVTSDEPPADYSRPDYLQDVVVKAMDSPFDTPSLSRRTQSLPGILVGRELVKQTHLYTGEEVRVVSPLSDPANPDATGTPIPFNRDYRVAGIFFTGMYEYDLKYVYVTLDSLQEFLDRGDAVDGIEIRVQNPDDTDAFVEKLQETFGPHYRVQDWKELNRSLFSALKLEKIAMFLVLGIVILVASFSIVGNLIMVVVEKAREIALLKTLGASDVGVMQLFAIQGMMIGGIGTLLGIATGLLACWLLRFGFPLNADVYYIDRLPVHVDPMSIVAVASAGILISIAATLYPAVVAARVRPAAGMRH
jgi:lipoprotein-releasing system permease protein